MLFLAIFISSDYQSEVYSILCPCNVTYDNCTKTSEWMSKLGFFLSQSQIHQDLGFSITILVILTKVGWLNSLSITNHSPHSPVNSLVNSITPAHWIVKEMSWEGHLKFYCRLKNSSNIQGQIEIQDDSNRFLMLQYQPFSVTIINR